MSVWARTKENLEIFYNNNKVVCVLDMKIINDFPKNARSIINVFNAIRKRNLIDRTEYIKQPLPLPSPRIAQSIAIDKVIYE